MPLYEYRCQKCRRRVTILVQQPSKGPGACPECGGAQLERLFSSFRMGRSEMQAYDDILTDNQLCRGLMKSDPRALAEWNKRMSRGSDETIAPEYEEMLEKMESGEMPVQTPKKEEPSGDEP